MNKFIHCPECFHGIKKQFGYNPYEGEFCEYKEGEAKHSYLCDGCNTIIPLKGICGAVTLYTGKDHIDDVNNWPEEYIETKNKES
jgi:hypothetical protein